jgi:hypothetical protein
VEVLVASWGEFMIGAMDDGRRKRHLDVALEGFDAAAGICLDAMSNVLDRIEEKVDAGKPLSSEEKVMRTELLVLKSKIERKLSEYLQTTYGG